MKLWITGARGMLGKAVVKAAEASGHDVVASGHWDCQIDDVGIVTRAVRQINPDAIINCAGKRPGAQSFEMIAANTLGPHILAHAGVRLIHMSTDCVFSGRMANGRIMPKTSSSDRPDPDDLYGRTKLAGEVQAPHVLNVRGSFIGPEHGFLHWLLHASGQVEAWDNAWWSGTTADVMAAKLVELATEEVMLVGVVHVATYEAVSKSWMVDMFTEALGLPVEVVHKDEPKIFRALEPDIIVGSKEQLYEYAKGLKVAAA